MHRRIVVIVLLCLGLFGVVVVGGVGAPHPVDADLTDGQSAQSQVTPEAQTETSAGEPGVEIDESLQQADGTVEMIVSLGKGNERVSPADRTASVAELREHANASQTSLVAFAQQRPGVTIEKRFWLTNAVLVSIDTDRTSLAEVAAVQGVEQLVQNAEVEAHDSPGMTELAASASEESDGATDGLEQIGAPEVWDTYGTYGEGTAIAVLDTGVDADHQDITLTEWAEFDTNGNQIDSDPYDSGDHGTHASGIAAGGNVTGTHVGVAPETELHHGGVLTDAGGTFGAVIGGMEWAVTNDVDVITMSLGLEGYTDVMIDAVRNAEDAGTTVVASVGNTGEGSSSTPGNTYDGIGAGASDADGDIAGFSSGEVIDTDESWSAPPADWPDEYTVPTVAAPGVWVISTVPGDSYEYKSGTSMAAPHVAGAVALIESAVDRELSPDEIKDALEATAWKPDDWNEPENERDTRYGSGIIDVPAAIDYLSQPEGATFQVDIVGTNSPVEEAATVEVTAEIENTGTETGTETVTLAVGDLGEDTVEVTLDAGETVQKTLAVETADGDAGDHTATVTTPHDEATTAITLLESATFTVGILDTTAPVEGENLEVIVAVENTGDVEDTQTVDLEVGVLGNDETAVTLAGGESTQKTLTIGTESGDAGKYTATVTSEDDDTKTTVDVLEPASFAVSILDTTDTVEGENLEVEFEVDNTGDAEATQAVELTTSPGLGGDITDVTLAGGASTTEVLSVATKSGDAGDYTLTVASEDDEERVEVSVLAEASFAVDILDASDPIEGNAIAVEFAVENLGEETATQTVTLDIPELGSDEANVTLAGGEVSGETLTVATETGDAGNYTAVVASEDDSEETTVEVLEPATFAVSILDTTDTVEDENIEVEFQVENTGAVEATQTIELSTDPDIGGATTERTLAPGATAVETLSVPTNSGDAGKYTVSVASEEDEDTAGLTVLEPAAFTVDIVNPTDPVEGDDISVTVAIENTGGVSDTQTVTLDVNELGSDSTELTLAGGEAVEVTLSVGTEPGDAGEYTATATTADDEESTEISVLEPAAFTVDVVDATDPVEGDTLTVTAEIGNAGDVSATQTAVLEVTGLGSDAKDISLAGGDSTTETFSVETSAGDADEYTAFVSTDDDSDSTPVAVLAGAAFELTLLDVTEPVEGAELAVTVAVENVGDVAGTETLTLVVGGLGEDTVEVTLDGGATSEETLSVGTAGGDAGEYVATVSVGDEEDTREMSVLKASTFDVDIIDTTEPVEGNALAVTANIANTGDVEGTETVTLTVDGLGEDHVEVTLGSGEASEETLSVDTDGGDAGEYTAVVTTDNDEQSVRVTVLEPVSGLFTLRNVETNTPLAGSETLDITVTIENTGSAVETQTVTAHAAELGESSEEIELDAGETKTVTLSLETEITDTGEYEITIASGDTTVTVVAELHLPPLSSGADPPQDLTGDGRYEDLTGDGEFTIADVQALFDNLNTDTVKQNPDRFGFYDESRISIFDVQALFNRLQSS